MRKLILSLIILLLLGTINCAMAKEPSIQQLETMLKASGAMEMLRPMLGQLLTAANKTIKEKNPNLSPKALEAINDELTTGSTELVKALLHQQVDFYAKHLTASDVDALIEFYRSDAWKHLVTTQQLYVTQHLQTVLQEVVPAWQQEMIQRINDRLERDGFIKKKDNGA